MENIIGWQQLYRQEQRADMLSGLFENVFLKELRTNRKSIGDKFTLDGRSYCNLARKKLFGIINDNGDLQLEEK